MFETVLAELTQELNSIDGWADVVLKTFPKPAWEETGCPRCAGKGEAHFIGPDRAPGVCFRCGGTGMVPKPGKNAAIAKTYGLNATLARYRAMWKAYSELLPKLQAAAEKHTVEAGPRGWRFRRLVEDCQQRMASVEVSGKNARAELDKRK